MLNYLVILQIRQIIKIDAIGEEGGAMRYCLHQDCSKDRGIFPAKLWHYIIVDGIKYSIGSCEKHKKWALHKLKKTAYKKSHSFPEQQGMSLKDATS